LTLITETSVPDDLYKRVREQFSEEEIVKLTLAVVQINAWNRFAKSFRPLPGSYEPAQDKSAELVNATV